MVYPTTSPPALMSNASSGSGTSQPESLRMPTALFGLTTRLGEMSYKPAEYKGTKYLVRAGEDAVCIVDVMHHVPPVADDGVLVLAPRREPAWSNSVPYGAGAEAPVVRVAPGLVPDNAATVLVTSAHGSVTATAVADPAVRPGVVSMTHGQGAGPGRLTTFQTGYAGGWTTNGPTRPRIDVAELPFGAVLSDVARRRVPLVLVGGRCAVTCCRVWCAGAAFAG